SQDFCCEACGCSMCSALLPLTSNSNPSAEDRKAKELAQQIKFKAESSIVTQAGTSRDKALTVTQGDDATFAEQQTDERPQAEQVGGTLPCRITLRGTQLYFFQSLFVKDHCRAVFFLNP
ncbi:hypothetical protein GOODEAATRI_031466, partial [Goodea atripinnis]